MPKKIYVASRTRHASMWRSYRAAGFPIISTWIDEAGEGESESLEDLSIRCVDEASSADYLILYAEEGETLRGALIEAGAALTKGKPVLSVGFQHEVFEHHPHWIKCKDLNSALSDVMSAPDSKFHLDTCDACDAIITPTNFKEK